MVVMNGKMQRIMKKSNKLSINIQDYQIAGDITHPTFNEIEGCILLNPDEPIEYNPEYISKDRTGFEAFHNHIHLSYYIAKPLSVSAEGFIIALSILETWERIIKEQYPNTKFVFIISIDSLECTFRFHRIRDEEPTWIDFDNIEKYKDAVYVKFI